jgi:hypothetical protein
LKRKDTKIGLPFSKMGLFCLFVVEVLLSVALLKNQNASGVEDEYKSFDHIIQNLGSATPMPNWTKNPLRINLALGHVSFT